MEQYCIYLRKSRADAEAQRQSEEDVLARHEAALEELAGRVGISVARVFREVVSGDTIAARPVMQELLAQVEQGCWAGVLVMEIERLARGDTIDQGLVAQAFRYSGTRILTPLKTYDPADEFDEEYFEFGLFMSRREYKAINRRLQRGRLASAREGKFTGSRPPYGYRKEKLAGTKGYTLVPYEEEAAVVQLIYGWYTAGEEGARMGCAAIARRLDRLGIPSSRGGGWSPSTVRDLLRNPVYAGTIRWNHRPVEQKLEGGKRVQARPRREDYLLRKGLHPAIVEPVLWERVQKLFQNRSLPRGTGKRSLRNPLAGLVVCGVCGGRMLRKPGKNGSASLVCPTPGCSNVSAPLAWVEGELLAALNRWLGPLPLCLPEPAGDRKGLSQAALARLQTRLEQTERQMGSLHDLLEQGIYGAALFAKRSGELKARMKALRDSIGALERQPGPCPGQALPFAVSLEELYRRAGTPKKQNNLLGILLERAVYTRREGGRWSRAGFQLSLYPRIAPYEGQ